MALDAGKGAGLSSQGRMGTVQGPYMGPKCTAVRWATVAFGVQNTVLWGGKPPTHSSSILVQLTVWP